MNMGCKQIVLHESVAAQSDDTSGETTNGGTCDGKVILCKSYMHREVKTLTCTSNNEGTLTFLKFSLTGYKKNTTYTVHVVDYSCRQHTSEKNVCDSSKERTELLTLSEGGTTDRNS